jgi:hypothetical protein
MREIDELRITLFRTFRRHSTGHPNVPPNEVIGYWEMPLGIVQSISRILQDRFKLLSSIIKLQAYGRGLLVRLRDLKLVTIRRTTDMLGMYRRHGALYIWTDLNMRWDYKAIFARARGDRALRRSRKALGLPGRSLREWHYGFSYAIWRRWIGRKTAVENHYVHRNRLGVKLLDFGEP